jgi:hypothetical protein
VNARAPLFALLLAGCSQPPLAPSRTMTADPMLAALPSGVTLVAGADLATLEPGWFADELALLTETAGLSANHLVLGCGEHGCLSLVEAELEQVDWCELAEERGAQRPSSNLRCSAASEPGLDARLPGGEPIALRQLSPSKLVLGDRAAVRNAYPQARPHDDAGFEPVSLEGLVPEGDLWVAAHQPSLMALQAARRLEQNGSAEALALAVELRDAVECCSDRLEDVLALALAINVEDGVSAVLRVSCRDSLTARTVEHALDDRLQRAIDEGTPSWLASASSVELVRSGTTVELRAHSSEAALEGLLPHREVAP